MLAKAILRAWEKHGEVPFDLYPHEAEAMAAEIVDTIPLRIIVCEWIARRCAARVGLVLSVKRQDAGVDVRSALAE